MINDYAAMDRILREERKYILNQCKIIKKSGVNVLLIQKSILRDATNDLSLHFLAKMGIRVVTEVERTDIEHICTVPCFLLHHFLIGNLDIGLFTSRPHRLVHCR